MDRGFGRTTRRENGERDEQGDNVALTTDIAGVLDVVGTHLGFAGWKEVTEIEVEDAQRPAAVAECLIRFCV
jgi:hypothetical protein